jgi:hypothetical protein
MMRSEEILKIKGEKRAIGRVYLPESLDREARKYAETAGVTMSFLIRTALAEFMSSDREWQKIKKDKVGS